MDQLKPPKSTAKSQIALSIGDPTRFKNLGTDKVVSGALQKVAASGDFDGYPHSCGYLESRQAVAMTVKTALGDEDASLSSAVRGVFYDRTYVR